MYKTIIALFLACLPLMAEVRGGSPIPDVPEFSIIYEGKGLLCSPIELIKKKTHKDLVKYQCQEKYTDQKGEKKQDEARGHAETELLVNDHKIMIAQGAVYSV